MHQKAIALESMKEVTACRAPLPNKMRYLQLVVYRRVSFVLALCDGLGEMALLLHVGGSFELVLRHRVHEKVGRVFHLLWLPKERRMVLSNEDMKSAVFALTSV